MFSVLIVVLCPNCITDLGFSTCESQISLIICSRVLRLLRLGAGGAGCPSLRAGIKCRCWPGSTLVDDRPWSVFHPLLPDCFVRTLNTEALNKDMAARTFRTVSVRELLDPVACHTHLLARGASVPTVRPRAATADGNRPNARFLSGRGR